MSSIAKNPPRNAQDYPAQSWGAGDWVARILIRDSVAGIGVDPDRNVAIIRAVEAADLRFARTE